MKSTAIIRNVHVSSRKAKLVVDLIRGKKVNDAIRILELTNKKSAPILKKLLTSAIANSTNNHSMNAQSLYVYEVFANEGPTMKRVMARAKGSADTIFKRTTHFKIVLSDDVNERKNDLQRIKDRVKKRSLGNSKKVSKPIEKVETKKIENKVANKIETKAVESKTTSKKTNTSTKPKTTSTVKKTSTTTKKGETK
ncbi:MAG: 50S ribosomal protein L22 [Ureaplasma sp.]|nr:50S ribosomal protein L22 [Ureaplasma sp.]MDE7222060.1 50S ribosomal protein L22 [Ureaplasma sp.]